MANLVTNIGKGRFVHYATLPATNDALIAVVLEATGLEADDALQDYDDLAALLAGASNEQTTMGRKTLANVTVNVNDTANTASIDCDDVTWTAATGNATGKLVVCYDPDTTAGTDSSIIPLTLHDFSVTPDGTDITVQINAAGLATAANA
ncbi:hypothetical protein HOU95_gp012 [Streptomyces phage Hiyaa]|jgi:hypothetical protein|uniref:Uncharacterized protein n=1 Tax=Streptomyces phage Hiyaa TaxID=2499072 RepID=A0A3S9U8K5_9CAUD|nr:hypothetical protein HOU95_gp012 [Streptomyces phage Hiyaa]AZS06652.1 hypothetical protein SEA_HIYAA_12 [Streptomyces phage Hiyaa]